MKKRFTILIAALMLLSLITEPLKSFGQVSSAAPEDGKSYVVAAYVNSKYYALPCTTTNGSTLSGVEITLNELDMVNTSVASGKTWTLEKGTGDNASYYLFKYTSSNNTYYLYKNGTGKDNYNFKVSTGYSNYWSFATNGTGYTVEAIGRGTNNTNIQCNSGTFRCYSSATAIRLLEIGDVYTITYSAENGSISGLLYNTSTGVESGAYIVKDGKVTLTATPAAGYIFDRWEVSGANSSLSSTTTNPTTFTMGTANATVTAYFTASSTPTVTVTPNTLTGFNYIKGSASPSEYQSFKVNGANLSNGVTVTVDEGYIDNYAICKTADGTYGSSISLTESEVEAVAGVTIYVHLKSGLSAGNYNNNTITAKYDENADVKATVTVSGYVTDTHTLNISATNGVIKNGNVTMSSGTVAEGVEIEVTAVPNTGYKFTGWTVSGTGSSVESDTDNPTTFTMGTTDATLTATFEVDPIVKTSLTGDDMEDVTNAGTTYGDSNMKSVTTSDGFYWESNGFQVAANGDNPAITNMLQLRKRDHNSGVSYIKLPEFNGKIESIVFSVTDAANGSTTYANGGACKATVCFQTGTTYNETAVTSGGNTSQGTKSITLDLSAKYYSTGYITLGTNSAGARFWNIEVNYIPYSNFTEWTPGDDFEAGGTYAVTTNISTANVTIPATAGLVVQSGYSLTVTGTLTNNGTAANLIIEDGGQLILSNDNSVAATVKKTVNKPNGTWGNDDASGWYAISSPVGNIAPGSVTNLTLPMVSSVPQYDLYRYDEDMGWYNSQHSGQSISTLEKGHGYLYARSANASLSYAGTVTSASFDIENLSKSDVKHSGLHLIGNPYTHDIYLGAAITGDLTTTGYYALNASGSWISTANTTPIKPEQAVFVFVTKDDATISFNNTASAPAAKAHHDYIRFTVANSQYEDVAYAMFDKGYGLNKIEHRNSEAPMIYIPQNDDNYAIAMMEDNTQMFALNFKAATTGKYTLSYNTKGEFSYLHVIDRLTGEDVDMLLEDEYEFMASKNDNANRFIVKLEYSENPESSGNSVFAWQNGNDIIVNGEGELQVFDLMGRMISTQTVNGIETVNVKSQGVYIFRLNGMTQKIVVR